MHVSSDCSLRCNASFNEMRYASGENKMSHPIRRENAAPIMGGDLCGVSTGEALSRWCAATTSNNALDDFATAPQWADHGMPDFVNHTEPTDQKANSTGCGMAFLSWLMSQGYDLGKIAPAMV